MNTSFCGIIYLLISRKSSVYWWGTHERDKTFLVVHVAIITFCPWAFYRIEYLRGGDRLYQFATSYKNLLVKYSDRKFLQVFTELRSSKNYDATWRSHLRFLFGVSLQI